jgi:hypothetical protein
VAEGARLESVYTFTGIGGSNPSLSARLYARADAVVQAGKCASIRCPCHRRLPKPVRLETLPCHRLPARFPPTERPRTTYL